jgi:hypothetical protein
MVDQSLYAPMNIYPPKEDRRRGERKRAGERRGIPTRTGLRAEGQVLEKRTERTAAFGRDDHGCKAAIIGQW